MPTRRNYEDRSAKISHHKITFMTFKMTCILFKKLINKIFITKQHKDNMKSLPKLNQAPQSKDYLLAQCPQASKNQTHPQFCLKVTPESQEHQTLSEEIPCDNSSQGLKLKFNLCSDNLQCFMAKPKAQKYRSISVRLSKQSRSQASLQSFKLDLKQTKNSDFTDCVKSQTQRHHVEQNPDSKIEDDGDLSTILSNEIIHPIEREGIRYNWSDVEPYKYEAASNENKEADQEIEELFNAFSDKKYSRKSVKQNFSTNQSFVTQNSVIEGQQNLVAQSNVNNFLGYEGMAYNQYYDNIQDQSIDKNYSMASTSEPYNSMYYPMQMYQMGEQMSTMMTQTYSLNGLKSMPSNLFPSGEFIIRPEGLGKDPRTTLMIKNIPNKYTIQYLSDQIDQEFSNYYDFLYLPCDTKSGANQGYGFINFTDLQAIRRFYEMFHGKKWRRFRSQKICNLTYARLQGINSLIEHFQNSKVLNHKEKKYQPIIKKLNQQISNLIKEQQIAHQSTQMHRN